MKKCSVIIASYNEAENLDKCLNSLRNIDYPREYFEIIVIDNNSTDNTPEIVRKFPEIIYLREKKQGASFARNKGIDRAKNDILVFLDADTTVVKNWLHQMIEPFNSNNVGAVGGAILPLNETNIFSRYLGFSLFLRYPRYKRKKEIKGFPSCNLAVRKELIGRGFDTDIFSTYGEDKDLCYRVLRKGYRITFQSEAMVHHCHPETLGEVLRLLIKSSAGRAAFSKKYPRAPDIVLLNFHLPLIYAAVLVFSFFYWGSGVFLCILSPALIYLLCSSIISFIRSGDLVLSFFVKPLLDTLSVYVIYVSYHYRKSRRLFDKKNESKI